ncbi:MAG: DNA alkylation repair protein, partial [Elusimicrobiota bacterium]
LRKIAEDTGKDHKLALKFWATGIPEVMILASMIERPGKVTVRQAERWVDCIESWDVCDQLCMNLLRKVKFKEKLIHSWHSDEREFVKRCAFVLIAVSAVHDKKRADKYFTAYFPLIKKEARDSRKYVKKAVSWALRNIAKRNKDLKRKGLKMAKSLKDQQNRSSQWISSEVIKELTSEKIQKRFE